MFPEILLPIGLSLLGAVLLVFCVCLALMRTKRAHDKIAAYRGVNFAHRGLHGEGAAENSLSAFRRAVEAGFGIELDVRLSADGEMVVFHDSSLKRMCGEDKNVRDLTLAQLREYRLRDTEDTLPTLREVFEVVDGKVPLLIEIKEHQGDHSVTEKLLSELEGYTGPYIVESFNPMSLRTFRKHRRDVPLGVLSEHFCKQKEHKRSPLHFALQNMFLNFLFPTLNEMKARRGGMPFFQMG